MALSMSAVDSVLARRKTEEELLVEGWTRRFVGGPPRLHEMIDLYHELGFEVWLEPQLPDEFRDECQDCTLALRFFRVVYTRKRGDPNHPGGGRDDKQSG